MYQRTIKCPAGHFNCKEDIFCSECGLQINKAIAKIQPFQTKNDTFYLKNGDVIIDQYGHAIKRKEEFEQFLLLNNKIFELDIGKVLLESLEEPPFYRRIGFGGILAYILLFLFILSFFYNWSH